MSYFCTLFDSEYLTRGLALYDSLEKRSNDDFKIYILAMDDITEKILTYLSLKNAEIVTLSEFEDSRIEKIKRDRPHSEYCYACASFFLLYLMNEIGFAELTYLDSDIYFFDDPQILLDEFRSSGSDVMITEHNYSSQYDQTVTSGRFNVQFMTFKSTAKGKEILKWWTDRCEETTGFNIEKGICGDQKYLDDWPQRFTGVYVLKNIGGGVAPWNVQQYEISPGPMVNGVPVVFYHFHSLCLLDNGIWFASPGYTLSQQVIKNIYKAYVSHLKRKLFMIRKSYDKNFNKGFYHKKMEDLYDYPSEMFNNKKIVIYGAGAYGIKTYACLTGLKDAQIVGWLDRDVYQLKKLGLPVTGTIQQLNELDYDFLFIAIKNKDDSIKKMILDSRVEPNKIVELKHGA